MGLAASLPLRELPDNHSVIEFGVGSHPRGPSPTVLEDLHGTKNPHWRFDGNRSYTACDNGTVGPGNEYLGTPEDVRRKAQMRFAKYASDIATRRPGENIRFEFCDVDELDVPPGEELLVTNVLSSNIPPLAINRILASARDSLVVGGLMVVRETFTPHLHPPRELTRRLGSLGFTQAEVLRPGNPAFETLTAYYGPTVHDMEVISGTIRPRPDRYFCVARRMQ